SDLKHIYDDKVYHIFQSPKRYMSELYIDDYMKICQSYGEKLLETQNPDIIKTLYSHPYQYNNYIIEESNEPDDDQTQSNDKYYFVFNLNQTENYPNIFAFVFDHNVAIAESSNMYGWICTS